MHGKSEWFSQQLSELPGFLGALTHVLEHRLVDLDPWELFTSDGPMKVRSEAVNRRYPQRVVLRFARRRDTDDVACLVLSSSMKEKPGDVLVVHDFAKPGFEVDTEFPDFWDWFRVAVEDMIETFRHVGDYREG